MGQRSFGSFIIRLCTFFERKLPSDATINLWAEDIGNIPEGAHDHIESEFRKLEYWPRNTVAAINNFLAHWRSSRGAWRDRSCPHCEGGYSFTATKGGVVYALRCVCSPFEKRFAKELEKSGYSTRTWTRDDAITAGYLMGDQVQSGVKFVAPEISEDLPF